MSGPESFPKNTAAPAPPKDDPKYTAEELEKAREIMEATSNFSGIFPIKLIRASQALGYSGGYNSVPERIKSAISYLASQARARRTQEKKAIEAKKREKIKAAEEAKEIKRRADEANELAQQQLRDAEEAERALDIAQAIEVENNPLLQAAEEWNQRYLLDPNFRYEHGDPEVDPGILLGPKEFGDIEQTKKN